MEITAEQWKGLQETLQGIYVSAKLRYGDHDITVEKRRVGENKYALAVFLDGSIKGSWFDGDDEVYGPLVKLFWRKRTRALFKPKEKSRLKKDFNKRQVKELFPRIDETWVIYDPTFNTAASLIRQFKKIEGLELVTRIELEVASEVTGLTR